MAKENTFHKLSEDNLKEVSGGQTIGEWQAQHRIQTIGEWAAEVKRKRQIQLGPVGNQTPVKQGQSGTGNPPEFWEDVWCPICKAPFRANIMLNTVYCEKGHPIEIRG